MSEREFHEHDDKTGLCPECYQRGFDEGKELAARWCEQQIGDMAAYFTAENAAAAIRALEHGDEVLEAREEK